MKRILVLSNALSGGGAEVVTKSMVQRIDRAICVVFENDAQVSIPGRRIVVTSKTSEGGLWFRLLVNLWRLFVIQWVKVYLRPTVTISHLEGPNFANLLTVFGGTKVIFVHNRISKSYSNDSVRERLLKRFARYLYHRADRVVGVSPEVCRELVESFKVQHQKVLFSPNPIDCLAIKQAAVKEYGDFRDRLLDDDYLISVASLTPQKNHELMIRVFQRLVKDNEKFNGFKLLLLGDGALRASLCRICSKLDLSVFEVGNDLPTGSEQVYLLGFEENPYPLIKHAKLLLMTSRWEGLPIALLEAMCLGVPAVVSNCSDGIRVVWNITGEPAMQKELSTTHSTPYGTLISGIESDKCTVNVWMLAIKHLLEDKVTYENCMNACRTRSGDYDINRIAEIWKKLFIDHK